MVVYSVEPPWDGVAGPGTGSAGWMYRAGLEWVLGFKVRAGKLLVDPCIPAEWPGFQITFQHAAARYDIAVDNPEKVSRGIAFVELDGKRLPAGVTEVALAGDGSSHKVRVVLGKA